MTIPPRKRQQLTAFLGGLSNATALKLFSALEMDRAVGGEGLPHDDLLGDLRGQLLARGATLPPRRPDARRLFFTPFEDFFIAAHAEKKRRARIARASLMPIWRLMTSEKALRDAAFAASNLDDALRAGGDYVTEERTLFIAAEAGLGRLCDAADADKDQGARIVEALGGVPAYQDLLEIRRLLTGVDYLKELQALVPSASPSLNEEQLYELRTLFLAACEQSRQLGAYLLLALKGRLEKPWRALEVYYHLAKSADERLLAVKDAAEALPKCLFEDFEALARGLERDGAGDLDAETALLRINYFADYADGLTKQAAKFGDNVFLNRVEACRDVAAEAFERYGELALASLRRAMPVRASGGSARLMSPRPDIARPLEPQAVEAAADAAALIAQSADLAGRLGAEAAYAADIAEDARAKVHAFAQDLVVEIRAAEGDDRMAARRLFDHILAIAEPLLDREETDLLRDRATAAAAAV